MDITVKQVLDGSTETRTFTYKPNVVLFLDAFSSRASMLWLAPQDGGMKILGCVFLKCIFGL